MPLNDNVTQDWNEEGDSQRATIAVESGCLSGGVGCKLVQTHRGSNDRCQEYDLSEQHGDFQVSLTASLIIPGHRPCTKRRHCPPSVLFCMRIDVFRIVDTAAR